MLNRLAFKGRVPALFRRRYISMILVVLLILLSVVCYQMFDRQIPLETTQIVVAGPLISPEPPKPQMKEIMDTFRPNQTITDVLLKHGLSSQMVYDLVECARPVYNLAKVKAEQAYWLCFTPEDELQYFRYAVDDEQYLEICQDEEQNCFVPRMESFPYEIQLDRVSAEIQDSLFLTVIKLGEKQQLALYLADIFGWDIDFYTDIQKGDSFELLVEKKYLDGEFKKYGAIWAASITNRGKEFVGFRFPDQNGKDAYYDQDGKALKKSFLKSPLKYARISSRFSYARRHPILKIVRPHLGVDYAAPTGTPVQAVGAGVVVTAGTKGANGKMVKLSHAQGYETMYLHLSRIAVRQGARVSQGEVIGYVGSTGLATGPHLDFRISRHGNFINPTKVVFPPLPPVAPDSFEQFAAHRDVLANRLTNSGYLYPIPLENAGIEYPPIKKAQLRAANSSPAQAQPE